MKAIDRPFTKIINGTTQFVIPVFQRDYSWTEEECEQLWDDIVKIADDRTDRGHFLGSVVYVSTGDTSAGFTRWLLIDGQQRVTSLTLALIAMRDHIEESGWRGGEDAPTAKRLDAYFLMNTEEEGARRHKLVLRRHDQATLQALLDGQSLPDNASDRVVENYEYFRDRMRDSDLETVYRGIGRLIVVDVTLDRESDDPQLIFESLNSTGIDLSQSDLIRNFILMRLPEAEQTRLYESYWGRIEALFRGSERVFDSFARDYLALKVQAGKQEKADKVYLAFRRSFHTMLEQTGTLDDLLGEMLRHARYYAAFSLGGAVPEQLRQPLARLRRLVDAPAMLVMRLFHLCEHQNSLSQVDFVRAVELLESYVFRRAICGEQTRAYWQVFAGLAYQLDDQSPLDSLCVKLVRQTDSYRFPSDDEFREALTQRDLYSKRVCFDLLDKLENYGSREPTDTSKYSIEHVMPQNERLAPEWREMLGQEWKRVHQEWLHRLGNLTLTGYNSTYSDRPFQEKKTIRGGFEDSSVRLNKFIREQGRWSEDEMCTRGELLADRAIEIWPPLMVAQEVIEAAQREDMRRAAKRRSPDQVPMSKRAREIFIELRGRVLELDDQIIELAEKRSVSYHMISFFLELLPRTHRINALLPLDFNEIEDPLGIAQDASQWKFFVNASHEGGVLIPIRDLEMLEQAMPIIQQAYSRCAK